MVALSFARMHRVVAWVVLTLFLSGHAPAPGAACMRGGAGGYSLILKLTTNMGTAAAHGAAAHGAAVTVASSSPFLFLQLCNRMYPFQEANHRRSLTCVCFLFLFLLVHCGELVFVLLQSSTLRTSKSSCWRWPWAKYPLVSLSRAS